MDPIADSEALRDSVVRDAPRGVDVEAIKRQIHQRLLQSLDLNEAKRLPLAELHQECSRRIDMLLDEQKCPLSASARE